MLIELEQHRKLLSADGAARDEFGYSVALSGTTALVGSRYDDDLGALSGSAYLFDTTTGQQTIKLFAEDGAETDSFGFSVAIDGTTALVGARFNNDHGWNSGSAYLFNTTTGQQLAKLTADDGYEYGAFGASVAVDGTTALIGANRGEAYIFNTENGQQVAKLVPDAASSTDGLNSFVAISGTTALVGAPDDGVGGAAYLFDTTTGQRLAKLMPTDGEVGDRFGASVALSGTTALIGSWYDDDHGNASGSAYLFDTITGQQLAKLTADDASANSSFGRSVSVSGTLALISASYSYVGTAYVFDITTGQQVAKLVAEDEGELDLFGFSLALSGSTALIGAYHDDDNGTDSGSSYLFSWSGIDEEGLVPVPTEGPDRLRGTRNDDVTAALGGDDYIKGSIGRDQIDGGEGLDLLTYENLAAGINAKLHKGWVIGDSFFDRLASIEQLHGTNHNDRIAAGWDVKELLGQGGDDIIRVIAPESVTLDGGLGNDRIFGNSGNETVFGGDGDDRVKSRAGDDVVWLGADNDIARLSYGDDLAYGERGDDRIFGGHGNDRLSGGDGNDRLEGGRNADSLSGGNGDDVLRGGLGTDQLHGGRGDDILYGSDSPAGDGQVDTFVFRGTENGRDRIKDFEDGVDLINLYSFSFSSFDEVHALASNAGDYNLRIEFSSSDSVVIENFRLHEFDLSDVILS